MDTFKGEDPVKGVTVRFPVPFCGAGVVITFVVMLEVEDKTFIFFVNESNSEPTGPQNVLLY